MGTGRQAKRSGRTTRPKEKRPKYRPLARHILFYGGEDLTLGFEEVAQLVGGLPESAFRYRAWWANTDSHVQGRAWTDIGWRVEAVDLAARTVTFVRTDDSPDAMAMIGGGLHPTEARIAWEDGAGWEEIEFLFLDFFGLVTMVVGERMVQCLPDRAHGLEYGDRRSQTWYHLQRNLVAFPSEEGNAIALRDPSKLPGTLFKKAASRRLQMIRVSDCRILHSGVDRSKSMLEMLADDIDSHIDDGRSEVDRRLPYFLHEYLTPGSGDDSVEEILDDHLKVLVSCNFRGEGTDTMAVFSPQPDRHYLVFAPNEDRGMVAVSRVDDPSSASLGQEALNQIWFGPFTDSEPEFAPYSITVGSQITFEQILRAVESQFGDADPDDYLAGATIFDRLREKLGGDWPAATEEDRQRAIDAYMSHCVDFLKS